MAHPISFSSITIAGMTITVENIGQFYDTMAVPTAALLRRQKRRARYTRHRGFVRPRLRKSR